MGPTGPDAKRQKPDAKKDVKISCSLRAARTGDKPTNYGPEPPAGPKHPLITAQRREKERNTHELAPQWRHRGAIDPLFTASKPENTHELRPSAAKTTEKAHELRTQRASPKPLLQNSQNKEENMDFVAAWGSTPAAERRRRRGGPHRARR